VSGTLQKARAIEARLQKLQGSAGTGQLRVRATGADVVLPPGECAVPLVDNALNEQATIFVRPNPTAPSSDKVKGWTVTSAGTLVDVETLQGGAGVNLPGSIECRWDPPLAGLEETATLEPAGVTGATSSAELGSIALFRHYKQIATGDIDELFRAQVYAFPAAILAWGTTSPLDGPISGSPGPRTARVGASAMLAKHGWLLYLVTSRLEEEGIRRREGEILRDRVLRRLHNARRTRDRAFVVSNEPGTEVLAARVFRVTPTSYVDVVEFATIYTLTPDNDEPDANPWLRTHYKQLTPAQGPAVPLELPNIVIPIPPDGP
jgi:hypothetical protein